MKLSVKEFIEQNVDLIDANDFVAFFENADTQLSQDECADLMDIFNDIGVDATAICWKIFEQNVATFIDEELNNLYKTRSNDWARVDYMLDGISSVGFSWQEAKDYVLTNQEKLGLRCRELESQYGWQGFGDYAFQWFNEKEFEKEYLDE